MMTRDDLASLRDRYRDGLLHDTIPFWFPRSVDREHGGFLTSFGRDGTLLQDDKYARWHRAAHDWAYAHFPDPEHGERFGYLHRDGTVSTPLKGNMWKGFFPLPRMQWYCWQRLEEMLGERA